MNATGILRNEHAVIKKMLTVSEAICAKLDSGENVEAGHLERVVEFLRGFADTCHHAKEENLLFAAMAEAGVPVEGGPIGVMLAEHNMARGLVAQMGRAAGDYEAGDTNAKEIFVEKTRQYAQLLTHHIFKEDNILYPLADAHLTPDQQTRLVEDFGHVEHDEVGERGHEHFLEVVSGLEAIYLPDNTIA